MEWKDVGAWLKENAGTGAALVGSLLSGNLPGAFAAGVSLVTGATGEATPEKALAALQTEPGTLVRLRELAIQEEASIREHIRAMTELELKDKQAEHEQTQLTIRSGDNAEDKVVRRTRPLQSWASLVAGFAYVFTRPDPSMELTLILFTLPWAYAGLRQVGKGMETLAAARTARRAS